MNFKSLISDDNKNMSIGRTLLWLFTLSILYKFVLSGQDIPANIVYIYGFLITYNLLKKPLPLLEKYVEIKTNFNGGNKNVDNSNNSNFKEVEG
jgi:hypothetical protein